MHTNDTTTQLSLFRQPHPFIQTATKHSLLRQLHVPLYPQYHMTTLPDIDIAHFTQTMSLLPRQSFRLFYPDNQSTFLS